MSQTAALFIDAYRELNNRKLFWITLILSGLVVVVFACIGINERGVSVLVWTIDTSMINSDIIEPELFYKTIFTSFGINFWITWLATILALVSTAGIFPDLVSSGSIPLLLSKPIGRMRLYLTKYAAGLLFVGLQVTVFTIACFLVMGLRGGAWEPAILLAIPVVLVFYSYLFSICALLGVLTRSTIASLLFTLLFWLVIFSMHGTESGLLMKKLSLQATVADIQSDITLIDNARQNAGTSNTRLDDRMTSLETELAETEASLQTWTRWHTAMFAAKTVLPKTSETVTLLQRWLIDFAEMPDTPDEESTPNVFLTGSGTRRVDQGAIQMESVEVINSRSVAWVVGTSLAFEAVMLLIGGWLFSRRDY